MSLILTLLFIPKLNHTKPNVFGVVNSPDLGTSLVFERSPRCHAIVGNFQGWTFRVKKLKVYLIFTFQLNRLLLVLK